jgi:hypothetical protein
MCNSKADSRSQYGSIEAFVKHKQNPTQNRGEGDQELLKGE